MRLLFVQPPLGDGTKRMPNKARIYPWGFASIARCLEDDGHEIAVLDVYADDLIREEVETYLDSNQFDAICITGFSSVNYLYIRWFAEEVRKRYSIPIVIGGVIADNHCDLLLKKQTADICVLGEGELTSLDLFHNLDRLDTVKGIAYRRNGDIAINEPRELIRDLDTLELPNFDHWNMERYTKVRMYAHDRSTRYEGGFAGDKIELEDLNPGITFQGGRGCPYRCKFCARSYQQQRLKSVGRIVEEITYLKEKFDLKSIHFTDELVISSRRRTMEICEAMKKIGLYWDGQARVNTLKKDMMVALKDANCVSVGIGIESGSDEMLKRMVKGITREQCLRVLRDAKEVGLHLKIQLMGGYPGENKETLRETAELMKEVGLPPRRLTWCTPLPGSELYDECLEKGMIPDEEEYITKLHTGYNHRGHIVLNASGNSDEEMLRLLDWVTKKMNTDFLLSCLKNPRNWTQRWFRDLVRSTGYMVLDYHSPALLSVVQKIRGR